MDKLIRPYKFNFPDEHEYVFMERDEAMVLFGNEPYFSALMEIQQPGEEGEEGLTFKRDELTYRVFTNIYKLLFSGAYETEQKRKWLLRMEISRVEMLEVLERADFFLLTELADFILKNGVVWDLNKDDLSFRDIYHMYTGRGERKRKREEN